MKRKTVIIIGAGIHGMATGLLLADRGYNVKIVDMNDRPGGVARVYRSEGYTFDMGPTWYLMPEVFERYFQLIGSSIENNYKLYDLDPSYRVFFSQDDVVDITRDQAHNQSVFNTFEYQGGKKLSHYLQESSQKYDIALNHFLYKDYLKPTDFLDPLIIKNGLKLHAFAKLDNYVKRFFSSDKARKILEFNTVFLGSSPKKTPALYSLMGHVDLSQGIRFPAGGIGSFIEALYNNCLDRGVQFFLNHRVDEIAVEGGRAHGVAVGDTFIFGDIVLATPDYQHVEHELLDPEIRNYSDNYWKRRVIAPATFLMYLGVGKKIPQLAHHNFYFAQDWDHNFIEIFDSPSWPTDPSYYVGCPSRTDPSLAPEHGENLFILVPVSPYLEDSNKQRKKYSHLIMDHLESLLDTGIRNHLEVQHIYTQRDFKQNNNLAHGTALGLAHTLFQTAIFRPSHINRKVPNLYYGGHYTQPGIGMPMAMIGSELIAQRIEQDHPVF